KKISGGLLIEDADRKIITAADLQFVTVKRPSEDEIKELLFAQNLVKHVKSNAILLARNGATVGIGAGQMSRIDALEIAIKKANSPVKGCVLASDAFFPFRDCVDTAAKHGITAIIQPGGSVRDQDSIDACNELGIAMVFTGARSFRHL
ncbi:MAG TPA: bifunctional phosphoribosylaminoimidazolecarboxamide formyltransferase/IMP cyclohydrolase, partial [bacterium]|nr:bifunctional phosphoribosylaminoimidazolecarboxamide formyltransferase/IMP cyclohydrolase [bacterium]